MGSQLRDALMAHPSIMAADTERLEELARNAELIADVEECSSVMSYLTSKIASIKGQLETSRIAAEDRGASDAYLDWHRSAHAALSISEMEYERVRRQRHYLHEAECQRRKDDNALKIAETVAQREAAKLRTLELHEAAIERGREKQLHKRVCDLIEVRYGREVHIELFQAARTSLEVCS